jgi:hypothetical protein
VAGRWSLGSQRPVPLEPLKLTPFLGRQLLFAELDHDLPQRAGELERHLRVVLVYDWRTGVHADVKTLVERELAERIGLLDATFPNGFAIDGERSLASLADATSVVNEIQNDSVLARRELVSPGDAGLILPLVWVLVPVLVRDGVTGGG